MLADQRPFGKQFPDPLGCGGLIHLLEQALLRLRTLPVADRVEEQVAHRPALEQTAEHVVDPPAERLPRHVQLFQQTRIDRTLAGVLRYQVPEMTDLGLADPVDAPETLFQAVRVPGQVVVDHQVGALEVHSLPGGVVRHHDDHLGVVHERLDRLPPRLAGHAAVDHHHRLAPSQPGADAFGEVLQGVAGFGEDDELPPVPALVTHQRVVEDGVQLAPLGVRVAEAQRPGLPFQPSERRDLRFQLLHGGGGRRLVENALLRSLDLLFRRLFKVIGVESGPRGRCGDALPKRREPVFHPGEPPFQALVDRRRGGSEAALQNGEGETHVHPAPLVGRGEPLGAVHLLPHVAGDRFVEGGLRFAQLVLGGVGASFREERRPVEAAEFLLGQAAEHVARILRVRAGTEPALEAVRVEEGEEELEVLLLAVVRGRRHQQEVAGAVPEQASELIPLGVLDLRAEVASRHPVGLVAHHEVPFVGVSDQVLEILPAAQHVESGDQPGMLGEGVTGSRSAEQVPGKDREVEIELLPEFVLPLLDERPGRHHQTAFEVAPDQEFLYEQPGHDRLPRARVVGEQEAQRMAVEHRAVNRGDLVGQRLDL